MAGEQTVEGGTVQGDRVTCDVLEEPGQGGGREFGFGIDFFRKN